MKPAPRASARSRPRNLDISSQLELFPSLPSSAQEENVPPDPPAQPSLPAAVTDQELPDVPTPQTAPSDDVDESDISADDTALSDDASDFDPATMEPMTTMPEDAPTPVPSEVEQPSPEPGQSDLAEAPEPPPPDSLTEPPASGLLDDFDSDPFFNPDVDPPVQPTASEPVAALQDPAPTAEERLLDSIVDEPAVTAQPTPRNRAPIAAPDSDNLRQELKEARAARTSALASIDRATTERDRAQAHVAQVEKELTSVREQLSRESQLRKTDAARFAAAERDWTRRSLSARDGTLNKGDELEEARPRRYPTQVIAMTLVAFVCIAGLSFVAGRFSAARNDLADDGSLSTTPEESVADVAPSHAPAVVLAPPETRPVPPPWPTLEGTGFKATASGNALIVRFNHAVFARGTEMAGAACQDLRRIASSLTPSAGQLRIEVEGHTDTAPVGSGRPYAGNRELALARAKVVAEYLTRQCGLPSSMLSVTSAGDANPPHPNTTTESRKLNRTVVLKVTQTERR